MNETIPRWQLTEERLAEHITHDQERFGLIHGELREVRTEMKEMRTDIRSLLQWRWQLTGVIAAVVFLATLITGWLR